MKQDFGNFPYSSIITTVCALIIVVLTKNWIVSAFMGIVIGLDIAMFALYLNFRND